PALRRRKSLAGAQPAGAYLYLRQVPEGDFGDRWHHYASVAFAAHHLVLGSFSDGDASNGMSALQLQNELGLGSYKTAWLLAMKLRLAAVAPGRSPLSGLVEVDETDIPFRTKDDPPAGGQGRSHQGKLLVAGAAEIKSGKKGRPALGRVRLCAIADYRASTLHAFMRTNIASGATAKTDGFASYPGALHVSHEPHVIGPMAAHIVLPAIHRVFSNLKTWGLGVYHGLRRKHLQAYLDEFAFRFNRRKSR